MSAGRGPVATAVPLVVGALFVAGITTLLAVFYGWAAAALLLVAVAVVAIAVALAAYRSTDTEVMRRFAMWADSTTHRERVAYSQGYLDGVAERDRRER